ncbi:hypothetical protein PRUPE_1G099800 [Prunus persica]|uniref:Uncharacterized protein n=1 Tax=Prunus persica TaxID=3760 RepID=A0A251QY68_PRUPE|nr:hypothetical protein PRUPE_1G099800 [Prunus persica]
MHISFNLVRYCTASTVGRLIRFAHQIIRRYSRDARFLSHSGRASIQSKDGISKHVREVSFELVQAETRA